MKPSTTFQKPSRARRLTLFNSLKAGRGVEATEESPKLAEAAGS